MITLEEATRIVLERARALPPRLIDLNHVLGRVLAEDVAADRDSPPFDKALVDGFAVRSTDFVEPVERSFQVVEEVVAGVVPTRSLRPGEATAIMTGAPLPENADAVVMIEESRLLEDGTVLLRGPVRMGQNRLVQGREFHQGETLLSAGTLLNAVAIGLLGTVGRSQILAIPRPRVAVVATGDELVGVDATPGPGQIRNSNAVMLAALTVGSGAWLRPNSPIARDDPASLRKHLGAALRGDPESPHSCDVLIVSGGVSAGRRDLVPEALEALGVEPVFHKVRLKPGKPLWFGVGPERPPLPRALVFGLPGNPVSSLVGMLLFVRPAIEVLRGLPVNPQGRTMPARLARPFQHRGDRPTFHPCLRLATSDGQPVLEPLDWAGSPDLRTVARADGFAHFPAGDRSYSTDDPIAFLPLDV